MQNCKWSEKADLPVTPVTPVPTAAAGDAEGRVVERLITKIGPAGVSDY